VDFDLVTLNYDIYILFKQMVAGQPSVVAHMKVLVISIFYGRFWDLLGVRDECWVGAVGGGAQCTDRLDSYMKVVINYLAFLFGKTEERGILENLFLSKRFVAEYDKTIAIIFKGIAKTNYDVYDNSLLNAKENIKYSFSDDTDIVTVSVGDIIRLKNLLVKSFKGNVPFLLQEEGMYQEPLKVILTYLDQDEYEYEVMDITDQHINLNIKLKNKFFMYDQCSTNMKLVKCSKCELILPQEMLWEQDRMVLEVFEKEGWPCFYQGQVHYYNPVNS
jgi:hypothetical protein